ncbi:MAG TPA: hypothetical protein DDX98_14350 [Bacteroidales bacterium]|jgi:uncharacterized protein involved in tolerance to divalent cations|nr:hypothetical protein [Bacteroidales bacterium]
MILAYIISNSAEEAENIATELIEKKLVFSVNIIPDIKSMRRDGDKIVKLKRTIVLAKTKSLLYKEIEAEVKRVQTTGTAIVFSMPLTQLSQDLFDSIQLNTLKA